MRTLSSFAKVIVLALIMVVFSNASVFEGIADVSNKKEIKKTPMHSRGLGFNYYTDVLNDDARGNGFYKNSQPKGEIENNVNVLTGRLMYSLPIGNVTTNSKVAYPIVLSYQSPNIAKDYDEIEAHTATIGLNWSFATPEIVRASMGTYSTDDDEFYCSFGAYGGGKLIFNKKEGNVIYYNLSTDPSVQIISYVNSSIFDPDKWEVIFSDGMSMVFGSNSNAKLQMPFTDNISGHHSVYDINSENYHNLTYKWKISLLNHKSPAEKGEVRFSYQKLSCGENVNGISMGDYAAAIHEISSSTVSYEFLNTEISPKFECESALFEENTGKTYFRYNEIQVKAMYDSEVGSYFPRKKIVFTNTDRNSDYNTSQSIDKNLLSKVEFYNYLGELDFIGTEEGKEANWSKSSDIEFYYSSKCSWGRNKTYYLAAVRAQDNTLSEYEYDCIGHNIGLTPSPKRTSVVTQVGETSFTKFEMEKLNPKKRFSNRSFCSGALCYEYITENQDWYSPVAWDYMKEIGWAGYGVTDRDVPRSYLKISVNNGMEFSHSFTAAGEGLESFSFFPINDVEFGLYYPNKGLEIYLYDPYDTKNPFKKTSDISWYKDSFDPFFHSGVANFFYVDGNNLLVKQNSFQLTQNYYVVEQKKSHAWGAYVTFPGFSYIPGEVNSHKTIESGIDVLTKKGGEWVVTTGSDGQSCQIDNKYLSQLYDEYDGVIPPDSPRYDDDESLKKCLAYQGGEVQITIGNGFFATTVGGENTNDVITKLGEGYNIIEIYKKEGDLYKNISKKFPVISVLGDLNKFGRPNIGRSSNNMFSEKILGLSAHGNFLHITSLVDFYYTESGDNTIFERNVVLYIAGEKIKEVYHEVSATGSNNTNDRTLYWSMNDNFFFGKDFFIVDRVDHVKDNPGLVECMSLTGGNANDSWSREMQMFSVKHNANGISIKQTSIGSGLLSLHNYISYRCSQSTQFLHDDCEEEEDEEDINGDYCGKDDKLPNSKALWNWYDTYGAIYGDYFVYDFSGGLRSQYMDMPRIVTTNVGESTVLDRRKTYGGGIIYLGHKDGNISPTKIQLPDDGYHVDGYEGKWQGLYKPQVFDNTIYGMVYKCLEDDNKFLFQSMDWGSKDCQVMWVYGRIDNYKVDKWFPVEKDPVVRTSIYNNHLVLSPNLGIRSWLEQKPENSNNLNYLSQLLYYDGSTFSAGGKDLVVKKVVKKESSSPKEFATLFEYKGGYEFDHIIKQTLFNEVISHKIITNADGNSTQSLKSIYYFMVRPDFHYAEFSSFDYPLINSYVGLLSAKGDYDLVSEKSKTQFYQYDSYINDLTDKIPKISFKPNLSSKKVILRERSSVTSSTTKYFDHYDPVYRMPKYSFESTQGSDQTIVTENRYMQFKVEDSETSFNVVLPTQNLSYLSNFDFETFQKLTPYIDTSISLGKQFNTDKLTTVSGNNISYFYFPHIKDYPLFLMSSKWVPSLDSESPDFIRGEAKKEKFDGGFTPQNQVSKYYSGMPLETRSPIGLLPSGKTAYKFKTVRYRPDFLVEAQFNKSKSENTAVYTFERQLIFGYDEDVAPSSILEHDGSSPGRSLDYIHTGKRSLSLDQGENFRVILPGLSIDEDVSGMRYDFWAYCSDGVVLPEAIVENNATGFSEKLSLSGGKETGLLADWRRFSGELSAENILEQLANPAGSNSFSFELTISSLGNCYVDDIVIREMDADFSIATYNGMNQQFESFGNSGLVITNQYNPDGSLDHARDHQGRIFNSNSIKTFNKE